MAFLFNLTWTDVGFYDKYVKTLPCLHVKLFSNVVTNETLYAHADEKVMRLQHLLLSL